LSESESAEFIFIVAENQSIIADNYIIGTNLTSKTYYCIQTINDKNETEFLKWNGIEYKNYDRLILNNNNDNQCPNSEEYFFS
jgi:hypothetical protein